jgi:hypothetical protein
VPAVPTTLACQLLAYIDTDPTDDPTTIVDADALYRQAVAQSGSRQWNFIAGQSIPLVIKKDRTLYYTGSTRVAERLNLQGKVYILQITNPIAFDGTPVGTATLEAGSLFMDWNCTFSTPQINPEAALYAGPAVAYNYPPPAQLTSIPDNVAYDALITFSNLEPNAAYLVSVRTVIASFPATSSNVTFAGVSPSFKLGDTLIPGQTVYFSTTVTRIGVFNGAAILIRTDKNGLGKMAVDNAVGYSGVYDWIQLNLNNDVIFELSRLFV